MYNACLPAEGWNVLAKLKGVLSNYNAILAGGTALAIQTGHRISVDLDFFTESKFRIESVISHIKKTGLAFRVIAEDDESLIVEAEGVKLSLFRYDYPFLDKIIDCNGIKVAGILDIASMKVIAICQRGTKRDFADLYSILQDIPFHKIANFMINKFGKERVNPVHIGKSLVYFSDAESDPEPQYLKDKKIDWKRVKIFFKNHVKQFVLDLDAASSL